MARDVGYNRHVKRAYGSEPILLDASPVTTVLSTAKPRTGYRKRYVFAAIFMCAVLTSFVVWRIFGSSSPAPAQNIPAAITSAVDFTLYAPGWLPSGAKVDQTSFHATADVVTYAITYGHNKKLVVTEQATPSNLDFTDFYDNQMTDSQKLTSDVGETVIGKFGDADLASVVAGKTWILIRSTSGIGAADLRRVATDLRS